MAESPEVAVRRVGDAGVLQAPGYINSEGGEKVAEVCDSLVDDGVRKLVLNLENCSIVNSVGISFLIEVLEKVTDLGGKLAFCCVGATIAKTLQIMGLRQKASLHDTEEQALAELAG